MTEQIERSEEEASLPVKLNDQERVSVAIKAANLRAEIDSMKEQAAAESKEWRSKIKDKDDELCRYLRGVETSTLEQTVIATRCVNKEAGITWIEFSGERYQLRELTPEEKTGTIFDAAFE